MNSKPELKITGRGIAVGCGASIMFVTGFLMGDGELTTLGACGLLILGGCYLLAPLNLKNLELSVQLPPRFFATRGVHADVELHNRRKWFGARNVEIRLCFAHHVVKHALALWTGAQSSSPMRERLSIPARAEFTEVDYELRSGFPLGLFELRQKSKATCPALVYPQPITPPELLWGGLKPDHHPRTGSALGDLFGEPRGIRSYQPGDKVARIHQTASARSVSRGLGLQVRAYDPPGFHPDTCRVVFHSHAREGEIIRLDRFDRALSLTAGVLVHLHASQCKVTFQADFINWNRAPAETRTEHIECLALLATARRAPKTKGQELAEVLKNIPKEEQLIIISDSPTDQWADLVPPTHHGAVLINIRQVRHHKPGMQFQPALSA